MQRRGGYRPSGRDSSHSRGAEASHSGSGATRGEGRGSHGSTRVNRPSPVDDSPRDRVMAILEADRQIVLDLRAQLDSALDRAAGMDQV
ncbi:hypothetical protein KIPB_015651 [Kipferlia bialata]|uniref:Uncharacterized protein n=1 Tax=Kipferlia bialata TaxID=797122 RepID=A0A391NUP8_9EUKA|nr:hypothetical protein KIPB_015651 [Kipferlia bialata]|eukprot:g15651.t1